MTFKNMIAAILIITLGIILVVHFTLFWIYGGVFIHESNKLILSIETAMGVAILGFGIERFISYAREKQQQRVPEIEGNLEILWPRTGTISIDHSASYIEDHTQDNSDIIINMQDIK